MPTAPSGILLTKNFTALRVAVLDAESMHTARWAFATIPAFVWSAPTIQCVQAVSAMARDASSATWQATVLADLAVVSTAYAGNVPSMRIVATDCAVIQTPVFAMSVLQTLTAT